MLKQNPRTMYPIIVYRIAQKKNWGTSENLIGGLNLSTKFHREIMGRLTDLIISESQREWVREGDWLLRGTLVDSCAAASRSYASRNFKAARVKRGRRARRARSKFISHHRTDCSSFHEQLLSLSLSLSLPFSLSVFLCGNGVYGHWFRGDSSSFRSNQKETSSVRVSSRCLGFSKGLSSATAAILLYRSRGLEKRLAFLREENPS